MSFLGDTQKKTGQGSEQPGQTLQLVLDKQVVRPGDLQGSLPDYFLL